MQNSKHKHLQIYVPLIPQDVVLITHGIDNMLGYFWNTR